MKWLVGFSVFLITFFFFFFKDIFISPNPKTFEFKSVQMSRCSINTSQRCVGLAFKKCFGKQLLKDLPLVWFGTPITVQIWSLYTLNTTPISRLNTQTYITKFLRQNHFMVPVRQCQVRLQIERTQAEAELSQTACSWQFTTYSSVFTKKGH